MKTVFTTGEAAKICKVSQQTIIRCFDSGQLKGFRVPGSRFRRIPRDQLYAFMRDNGIPTDALDSGKRKILVVDDDEDLVELIVGQLERDGRFEVRSVNNGFGAGNGSIGSRNGDSASPTTATALPDGVVASMKYSSRAGRTRSAGTCTVK